MRRYFFVTNHYMESAKDFGLKKIRKDRYKNEIGENYYFSEETSFDKGMGAENVFVYEKTYSFKELFDLAVSFSELDDNNLGAISFILNGTCKQNNFLNEFIDFLEEHFLNSNEYKNWNLQYFQLFFFFDFDCTVLNEDNLEKLRKFDKWNKIETVVLKKVLLLMEK